MKAMIWLGINCGFGNMDCATLTVERLDLKSGWHTHARPKTFVPRRAKLWPETVAALQDPVADKEPGELVFRTKYGNSWIRKQTEDQPTWIDSISQESKKIGLEFYNLRRTFRTITDETGDLLAVRLVMGHASSESDMDARYVQRIADERLNRVAEYVRSWLNRVD